MTGASSGFGSAITLAAAGDIVVAAARRRDRLQDLQQQHPDLIEALELDVTDAQAAQSAVAQIEARHGRIDVLVNNAGHGQVGAAEETTDEELRSLFELHFFAAATLSRAAVTGMRTRGSGMIVQISSVGGQVSMAGPRRTARPSLRWRDTQSPWRRRWNRWVCT